MTPEDVLHWGTFAHGSPIYEHLAGVISADAELMTLVNRVEHTPRLNVLLAAVQYLLARETGSELARFYPNFEPIPQPTERIAPAFRDFVHSHQEKIVAIGQSRYTQTNECRRCAVILPLIWQTGFERFHLVDIGTSAGLNLGIDEYRYRWGDSVWGPDNGLLLECEPRGSMPDRTDVEVLSRTGLDLHPVDPADPDERLWLESLVWPEQSARRERLRAALDLVGRLEIDFVRGDAVDELPAVLAGLPDGEPAVVINSFSMNQFTGPMRAEIEREVVEARSTRPITRISYELYPSANTWALLQIDDGQGWIDVGQAHPHGEWVELYARP